MSERILREAVQNYNVIMQQAVTKLEQQEQDLHQIAHLVGEALSIDGAHHKQWYLCQIGLIAGLTIDLSKVDGGIAP